MSNLKLYHSIESTCAHKVRLVLAEKQLQWEEQLINLRKGEQFHPDYIALNPKAVVPTLIHGDVVLRESTVINEYLDDVFKPELRPEDPVQRAKMRLWVKTLDDEIHPAVGIVSYATVLRHQMASIKSARAIKEHFSKIPDPARRLRQMAVHDKGVEADAYIQAIYRLNNFVGEMELELQHSDWLSSDHFSLADAAALPYVMRIDALQLSIMWDTCPHVADWYKRCLTRESAQSLADRNVSHSFEQLVVTEGRNHLERARAILERYRSYSGLGR